MSEERRLGSAYVLDERLGEGASGHVWAGHDEQGHHWAFKLLKSELATDPGVVNRFVQERSLLASITHEHVVQVHDLVVEGNTLAIVMDLVNGSDLRDELRAHGAMRPARVTVLGAQIAAALQSAHRRGVVHRDVKPENILIDKETGASRLTDFGIARLVNGGQRATMMLGTPLYMAPEIAEGRDSKPTADLYSLGVMLYEMCCGVTPFAGRGSVMATLRAHSTEEPGRPGAIPDPLWNIIARLLIKDPAGRPARAGEVANELAAVAVALEGEPAAPTLTTPPPPARMHTPGAADMTRISGLPAVGPTMLAGPGVVPPGAMPVAYVTGGVTPGQTPVGFPSRPYSAGTPAQSPMAPGYSGTGYSGVGYTGPLPVQAYTAPPPSRESGSMKGVLAGAAAVLVIFGAVAAGYLLSRDDDSGTHAGAATTVEASTSATTRARSAAPENTAANGGAAVAAPRTTRAQAQQLPAVPAPQAPVQQFVEPDQPPASAPDNTADTAARRDYADQLVRSYLERAESKTVTREAMNTYFTTTIQWYDGPRISRDELYHRLNTPSSDATTSFDDPVFRSFTPGLSYGSGVADRIVYDIGYTRPSGERGAVVVTYTLLRESHGTARITEVTERNA